jgi:hypothetical protein
MLVTCLCALAIVSTGSGQTTGNGPSLAVKDSRPFEIRGVGFKPGERVQILLVVDANQQWRTRVADPSGAFTAEFPVSIGVCQRFTLQAFGSKGSRARVRPRLRIDCVSPGAGGVHT